MAAKKLKRANENGNVCECTIRYTSHKHYSRLTWSSTACADSLPPLRSVNVVWFVCADTIKKIMFTCGNPYTGTGDP